MEALLFDPVTRKLCISEQDIPKITDPKQILIKVDFAGVCGTDLHIIDGAFPCKEDTFVLGHEFCGVAVEVGCEVHHIIQGDRVVVDPNKSCDVCDNCSGGLVNHCQTGGLNNTIGIFRDGGWAQYCLVPDVQVYRIPDNIPSEIAVLCEPISCISHGWDKISPITFGKNILVVGAGIIGNLWVCMLHMQGHKRVTVSEPNLKRLELLHKLETGYELLTPDVLEERKNNPFYGFDLVIDCSGSVPAMQQALSLLKPGGTLCIFGVADPKQSIKVLPFEVFKKELTIVGALINPFSFPKALAYLEALGPGYLDHGKLGIKMFALNEHAQAIVSLREGSIAKAIFKMS